MVEWLEPKPVTYRGTGTSGVDFENYLEGIIKNK